MSPGTRSAAGTATISPPRTTRALPAAICFNAAIARSARNSCTKPMTAFSTHDHDDRQRVLDVADGPRDHGRDEQDQDHEIRELVEQHAQRAAALPLLQLVGAEARHASRGFLRREPAVRIGAQPLEHDRSAQRVPRGPGLALPARGRNILEGGGDAVRHDSVGLRRDPRSRARRRGHDARSFDYAPAEEPATRRRAGFVIGARAAVRGPGVVRRTGFPVESVRKAESDRRLPVSTNQDARMTKPRTTHFDTLSLHAGAKPDPATGARATPIHLTASFVFPDSDHAAALFNMERAGHVYSRISNPTCAVLEERIAALEGGVGAIATASGQAALHLAIVTLMGAGGHIVASRALYGGSHNLLDYTLPRFGVDTTFVDPRDLDAWRGGRASEHAPPLRRNARQSRARCPRRAPRGGTRPRARRAAARRFDVHDAVPDAAVRAWRRPRLSLGDEIPVRPRHRDRRPARRFGALRLGRPPARAGSSPR